MANFGIVFVAPNAAVRVALPMPTPQVGEALVRVVRSAVSGGTERANLVGEPDGCVGIFAKEDGTVTWPRHCGYSSVGVVEALGEGVADLGAMLDTIVEGVDEIDVLQLEAGIGEGAEEGEVDFLEGGLAEDILVAELVDDGGETCGGEDEVARQHEHQHHQAHQRTQRDECGLEPSGHSFLCCLLYFLFCLFVHCTRVKVKV